VRKIKLKTGRAWALKESLRPFWDYTYPKRAETFFNKWYYWATHSRLTLMVSAAKTLKNHLPNILTFFKHRITNVVLRSRRKEALRTPAVWPSGDTRR